MKKILITGANSFIGTSFERWCQKYPERYSIDTVDMRDDSWKEFSFSWYDVVFHVAGIAHVSTNPKMEDLYYKVNRDLAIATAEKAKADGVKQFIFMSSIIVYGQSSKINLEKIITKDTIPQPKSFYGKSKLQAEEGIVPLQCENFNIVILRPPMIYGAGAKGNYMKLAKLARKSPLFPNIENKRSMLYIDNLCEFIRLVVDNQESGLFFPQNSEYVRTKDIVRLISEAHGRQIRFTKLFNPVLNLIGRIDGPVNKAFGSLVYDKAMSEYKENYRTSNFIQSIKATEVN